MRAARGVLALAIALAAGGALLVFAPDDKKAAPPAARVALAEAWPGAQRAEIAGNLRDGPIYHPGLFLDARTSVGTAPSPDGTAVRLLVRNADDTIRELRRRPLNKNPEFGNLTTGGDELVWTESADGVPVEIWTARTTGGPARKVTADTGNALFFGSQWDLALAGGEVHWAAASPQGDKFTEIRSVALAGGTVRKREEPGTWALSAWPWLTEGGGDQAGTTRLRNLDANRETRVEQSGAELATCSPVWCRVLVMNGDGLARIDVMHPDGSARQRIAGPAASAAITDVGVLDRFEILAEAGPDSDLTGTAGLLIYDITAGRTIDVSPAADGAFSRNGVLWWATGDQDALVWHTLDLRTV
ncbi:hypothetical protein [Actinoplanes friuliensis]|uniref:WD40 repeat domain-containing protein n=1 Tax=Actinoplanes friuliensis DSM 7358 TaxID=1246995 RepID=U5W2D6_9ACTN|nr:hypothetical protein [Actinoplanes friuliensis]AGZ43177.1 hypothetical protein AFR_24555 [Actinoplanes friuliensis DSM 7358]